MRDTDALVAWFGRIPVGDRAWLLQQLAPEERVALNRCLSAEAVNPESEWSGAGERLSEAPSWLRELGIAVLPRPVREDIARRVLGRDRDLQSESIPVTPALSALMTTLLKDGPRTPEAQEIAEDSKAPLFERLLGRFRGARS